MIYVMCSVGILCRHNSKIQNVYHLNVLHVVKSLVQIYGIIKQVHVEDKTFNSWHQYIQKLLSWSQSLTVALNCTDKHRWIFLLISKSISVEYNLGKFVFNLAFVTFQSICCNKLSVCDYSRSFLFWVPEWWKFQA